MEMGQEACTLSDSSYDEYPILPWIHNIIFDKFHQVLQEL